MAYPTVSAPYGLKPINLIGGQVFAGATRQLVIANTSGTGYGTSSGYARAGYTNAWRPGMLRVR